MAFTAPFLSMLNVTATVATVTWTDPVSGESEKTPSKSTRSVKMRIDALDGDYVQHAAGKRAEATHKAFADSDAALVEGEMVGVSAGEYANYRWEIVHVNPVHGHHYEAELKRVLPNEIPEDMDPLA